MSAVDGPDAVIATAPRRTRTELAFLLSPGIAALFGPFAMIVMDPRGGAPWGGIPLVIFCFAVVGYGTALVVAVPVYLCFPRKWLCRFPVVVPVAGAVAAAPWLLIPIAAHPASPDLSMAPLAFGLGCVAGVAFMFIRGAPSASSR